MPKSPSPHPVFLYPNVPGSSHLRTATKLGGAYVLVAWLTQCSKSSLTHTCGHADCM